jgi:cytidine deaminase
MNQEISTDLSLRLREAALQARRNCYAPYSQFEVGCALLTPTLEIISGANLENASFGLTLCAERVAMAGLRMAGHEAFLKIVVASPGGIAPCGACRQFLLEFVEDADLELIDTRNSRHCRSFRLRDLLPEHFCGASLSTPPK